MCGLLDASDFGAASHTDITLNLRGGSLGLPPFEATSAGAVWPSYLRRKRHHTLIFTDEIRTHANFTNTCWAIPGGEQTHLK